jgi:hypothetical protein
MEAREGSKQKTDFARFFIVIGLALNIAAVFLG